MCSAALTVVFTVVADSWFLLCRSHVVSEGCQESGISGSVCTERINVKQM